MPQVFVVTQKTFLVAHNPGETAVRVLAERVEEAAELLANGQTELEGGEDGGVVYVKDGDIWRAFRCERVFRVVPCGRA